MNGHAVYKIVVTSKGNGAYPTGCEVDAVSGDIYDTHRARADGRIVFAGKTWAERF